MIFFERALNNDYTIHVMECQLPQPPKIQKLIVPLFPLHLAQKTGRCSWAVLPPLDQRII